MSRTSLASKAGLAATFVIGVVSAPLMKPLLRITTRSTVKAVLQVKKLAAEAAEEMQDLVAEANADIAVGGTGTSSSPSVTVPGNGYRATFSPGRKS